MILLFLLALTSCAPSTPWKCDAIAARDPLFDSTRLSYQSPYPSSPLKLEFFRSKDSISAFLSLSQFQFRSSKADPMHLKAKILLGEKAVEEELPLLEGNMRLRLPPSLIDSLLDALKDGEKIAILVDGFEGRWEGEGFQKVYDTWQGKSWILGPLFKGPL